MPTGHIFPPQPPSPVLYFTYRTSTSIMKIEWASHYYPDGRKRTPPPSTMHGWLAKMRGTLIGNEELRSKGMREMKAARIYRQREAAKKKQQSTHSGKGLLSFLGIGSYRKPKETKPKETPRVLQSTRPQHGNGSRKPSHQSTHRHDTQSNSRPPLSPTSAPRRSNHQGHRQDSYHSQHTYTGHRRSSRR